MSTVFPVEFQILPPNKSSRKAYLLQAFTRDVSEGGLCLELKSFGTEVERNLRQDQASLELTINPAFSTQPILATARIVWLKKNTESSPAEFMIGVEYQTIDPKERQRLIRYARRMQWLPRTFLFGFILILAALCTTWLQTQVLIRENRSLVADIQNKARIKSGFSTGIVSLEESRVALNASLNEELMKQRSQYESELSKSRDRESLIRGQLAQLQKNREALEHSYQSLEDAGDKNSKAVRHQMSHWLLSHQNRRTGLVASYEGDPTQEDIAYTYDQSLACQTFLLYKDRDNAKKILDFYSARARRQEEAFFNAYDVFSGAPIETTVHTGPNLWIGIAALQYNSQTGSEIFIPLAKQIADWAIRRQDAEGGLSGGPGVSWVSTEHNLDAYAFFGMLYEVTKDKKYQSAQESVLGWIRRYAYSNKAGHINRGKGDATIATDTFGWSIAAIGPAKLKSLEFDPEEIMAYAEKNCGVLVEYTNPSGKKVQVRGFDFAKAQHAGRGGVLSTEWTAQMVVGYQVLARYFDALHESEKSSRYLEKARMYLTELEKMVITSPSKTGQGRGCLPYASSDQADTGHGWRTPQGSRTGSVAATAYGLFAWNDYNPFELRKPAK